MSQAVMNELVDMSLEIIKLKDQRRELLEALKLCAGVCAGEEMSKNGLIRALEKARSAMQKAEGATT